MTDIYMSLRWSKVLEVALNREGFIPALIILGSWSLKLHIKFLWFWIEGVSASTKQIVCGWGTALSRGVEEGGGTGVSSVSSQQPEPLSLCEQGHSQELRGSHHPWSNCPVRRGARSWASSEWQRDCFQGHNSLMQCFVGDERKKASVETKELRIYNILYIQLYILYVQLHILRNFFPNKTFKRRDRLPTEVVQTPSLEVFKIQLEKTMSNMFWPHSRPSSETPKVSSNLNCSVFL